MKTIISTKFKKNILIATLNLLAIATFAQETEEKKIDFSGSVDTYYRTALSTSDSGGVTETGTSFANQTGFALGMANLVATYEGEKTGVVADLVFGPRGDDASGGFNLNQLYVYWNVSEGTKLTLGRFNTYLGYEVIQPAANFNYSTSYLFSSGPFSHVGLRADFDLSDDFSLMLAVMDVTDVNNNLTGVYALGAQLGYADQFLNFYYDGGEALGFEVDYTGGFDVNDNLFLGINAAFETNDDSDTGFYGAALYPQYALSDDFSLGVRGEYFQTTQEGIDTSDIPGVLAFTLTGSFNVENLIIKPEIRLDSWNNDFQPFTDGDLNPTNSLSSFLIAAVYAF